MGYEPEPPPGLSELEDRHQLQRHARSLGCVAVPEELWERVIESCCLYPSIPGLWAAIRAQQEVIEHGRQ